MNQYQKLVSNTALFAISTFSSKVLVFLLMPFYTRVLSQADYGTTDIIIQTGNLLMPLASVGIGNSVIRFGLERGSDKNCLFTTGLLTTLAGCCLLLLATPLLQQISILNGYGLFVALYVLMADVHALCAQFVRTRGHVRIFAIDGILRTVLTIGLNILFLIFLNLGVAGYVLANILADLISTLFLFYTAKLHRYIHITALRKPVFVEMLRYCVPLIPTTICTWIINISDRYLITWMIGSSANGIYAVANKIPTVLLIVASIFSEAWQLSALRDQSKKEKERFFSNVFGVYQTIAFLTAAVLIMTAQLSTRLLAAPDYYEAWRYMPVLVVATTFACFASFLASVYMVEKRSMATLITTVLSAVLNIVGNVFLIQQYGTMGAAISTMVSYFVMFAVRAIHTRSMLRIHWELPKFILNMLILLVQCVVMVAQLPGWPIWEGLGVLALLCINYKNLLKTIHKVI